MFPTVVFHPSCVQVLWDHLRGAELSEKDGGESETIEASQKGRNHDYYVRKQRWTHRRQQDPPSTGPGCGIPGGAGSAQTHADKLLLSSVTNFSLIWNSFDYARLHCSGLLCVSDPEDGSSAKWHLHVLHSDGPCERGQRARWTEPVESWLKPINVLHSSLHFLKTCEGKKQNICPRPESWSGNSLFRPRRM